MWLMRPIGEMEQAGGEMARVLARISGEMSINDVPLNPSIDIQTLKAGDNDPLEVVVEVPATKSKRGWNYTPQSIKSLVNKTLEQGLPGFLGHQKPEDVNTEFPAPVTHWVGAKWDPSAPIKDAAGKVIGKGKGYFRGVVDKAAPDLKRWIKARAINTVSIYGRPKIQRAAGEINVIDYDGLSIDWTPLGRAGMPTAIVAMGEMDELCGEQLDGTFEELKTAIRDAARMALGAGENDYTWVRQVRYDNSTAIIEHESKNTRKIFSFPYGIVDGDVKLGEKKEVVRKEVYEPVGEMTNKSGGVGQVNWKELIAQIKQMLASRDVTLGQVVGEMGLTADQLAGEMQEVQAAFDAKEQLDKVKEALGVSGEMDIVDVAKEARKAIDEQAKAKHQQVISEAISERVAGEMAQALITRMLTVPEDATKEQIAGEIDTLLADETVKTAIGKLHTDKPPVIGGSSGDRHNAGKALLVKRQRI